jgi:hypothetical protein
MHIKQVGFNGTYHWYKSISFKTGSRGKPTSYVFVEVKLKVVFINKEEKHKK